MFGLAVLHRRPSWGAVFIFFLLCSLPTTAATPETDARCFRILGDLDPIGKHANLPRLANDVEAKLAALEVRFGPGYSGRTPEERRLVELGALIREARRLAQGHVELDEFLNEALLHDDAVAGQSESETKLAALVPRIRTALRRYLDPPPSTNTYLVEIRGFQKFKEGDQYASQLAAVYEKLKSAPGINSAEVLETSNDLIVIRVEGSQAWDYLRGEAGRHRFETKDPRNTRPRTLDFTVSVLPEPTSKEVVVLDKDLEWDTFTAGGPGGQHQNKTQSAVRVTHKPTGIAIESRSERSQLRNKEDALARLRAEIARRETEAAAKSTTDARRAQVGTSGGRTLPRVRNYDLLDLRVRDDETGEDARLPDGSLRTFSLVPLQPALDRVRLQQLLDNWAP